MKRIKNYLELCYDIEIFKAEIRILKKQKREIEYQIKKLAGAPASYPVMKYHHIKADPKHSNPPKLETLYIRLEELEREIGMKIADLRSLEYRKKNIDKIIGQMDHPKDRVAIMRELQGRTLAEIADELGYSESHIKRLSAEITQEIYSEK